MRLDSSTIERFWKYVQKTSTCWLWRGTKRPDGYGQLSMVIDGQRKSVQAHRASWWVQKGEKPPKLLMHQCNTPLCVRLHGEHAKSGTQKLNQQYMAKCGRQVFQKKPWLAPRGSRNGKAVLDEERVREIKRLANDGVSGREIARRFKMGQSHVAQILRGGLWAHV